MHIPFIFNHATFLRLANYVYMRLTRRYSSTIGLLYSISKYLKHPHTLCTRGIVWHPTEEMYKTGQKLDRNLLRGSVSLFLAMNTLNFCILKLWIGMHTNKGARVHVADHVTAATQKWSRSLTRMFVDST